MTDPKTNGAVHWDDILKSAFLQQAVQWFLNRYCQTVSFSFDLGKIAFGFTLSPHGSTVAITYKEPKCPSPDPEPKEDQSTVIATP